MIDFSSDEIIGLCESLEENDERISGLREQIKVINADTKARIEEFAKSNELNPSDVKEGYKHYKKIHIEGDGVDDLYSVMAKIDEGLSQELCENEDES